MHYQLFSFKYKKPFVGAKSKINIAMRTAADITRNGQCGYHRRCGGNHFHNMRIAKHENQRRSLFVDFVVSSVSMISTIIMFDFFTTNQTKESSTSDQNGNERWRFLARSMSTKHLTSFVAKSRKRKETGHNTWRKQ